MKNWKIEMPAGPTNTAMECITPKRLYDVIYRCWEKQNWLVYTTFAEKTPWLWFIICLSLNRFSLIRGKSAKRKALAVSIHGVPTGTVFLTQLCHIRDRVWGDYVKRGCGGLGPASTTERDIAGVLHTAFRQRSYYPHRPQLKTWWNDSDTAWITAKLQKCEKVQMTGEIVLDWKKKYVVGFPSHFIKMAFTKSSIKF